MHQSIVRLGHPVLRSQAESVDVEELKKGAFEELVSGLSTALTESRAAAVTAPQLAVELQVLAFRLRLIGQDDAEGSLQIVVNPMLEPEHGDLVYDWEGCLSVPNLKGLVPRYPKVRLRGLDENGEAVDFVAEGEAARVFQHAHDHLNGVVFLDRMRDLRSLAFGEEWRRYLRSAGVESRSDADG